MPGHRSPYSSRRPTRRSNTVPMLVISVLGLAVIVMGVFLLADRLGGRAPGSGNGNSAVVPATGGTPAATPVPLRSPRDTATAYVNAWNAGDYGRMYDLLSVVARDDITRQDFIERYQAIAAEVGETAIEAKLDDAPKDAQRFTVQTTRQSSKVGSIADTVTVPVVQNNDGGYGIDWTPSLIFADLGNGFVRWNAETPQRGRILDRKGRPLANLGSIGKIGVVPGQIQDEKAMLDRLSQALGMPPDTIKSHYQHGQPDWFMPVKNVSFPLDPALQQALAGIPGVVVQQWPERVYPAGPAAAHVVGYLTEVTAEELPELTKQGYSAGDAIGRAGLEAWGEQYLRGKPGGRLLIVGPDGAERRTLAEVKSQPAADLVTTIDLDVQNAAYQAMEGKPGSVVVIDPSSGGILAMVSTPTFDPNKFILGLSDQEWAEIDNPDTRPLLNHATQFAYPIGSTFKIVTTIAGMNHLGLTAQSTIPCPAQFSLPGSSQVYRDWMPGGQGTLTLQNALVQSCDTVMYQIGADLDAIDPQILPDAARAFGFGQPTGLVELPEVPGVVPDPEWKLKNVNDYWARGDAVNLSIGQGYFLGTSLQVANAYAAIANGGTLWQPYLVQEVVALDGSKTYAHQPKEIGKLPTSPEQIAMLHAALRDVVTAPNGTAAGLTTNHPFEGDPHSIAGKTGTAESGRDQPHAWFASFSPVDGAKLASAVMVEYAGEGSFVAAPIDRKVIDAYYEANP